MSMQTYEYGAMSSKYSLQAENKLTAYSAMLLHYNRNNHLIALYSPEECKQDNWLSLTGKISDRLTEIFGCDVEDYIAKHVTEVRAAYDSIKQIV